MNSKMKGDWLKSFTTAHNPEFTEGDYANWKAMTGAALPFYLRHLPEGSRLLECCCGPGCTAIPLSHHYKVTAFDRDERILSYAMRNAARFGRDITLMAADFWDVERMYGKSGFDACSTSGVLDHYPASEVQELVGRQLSVAPIAFIDVPLGDGKTTEDEYGIKRYNHTKKQWLGGMLTGCKIAEHSAYRMQKDATGGLGSERIIMAVQR